MGIFVEELARVLGPYRGFRLGADGSVSVYPASPRVLLPAPSDDVRWLTAMRPLVKMAATALKSNGAGFDGVGHAGGHDTCA